MASFFFCTIAAEMFGKTLRRQTALVQLAKVGTEIDQYSHYVFNQTFPPPHRMRGVC